jgi:putative SOS response-associated peptidase YedK
MNGFFEWKVLSDSLKLPFYFRTLQRDMFGVAGLYSMLEDEGGKRHYACTTLEVSSNELLEPLSATMPAILDDSDIEQWLNPLQSDVAVVEKLLKPCKTNSMASFRVDNTVNSTEAEGDELIKPVV